MSSAFPLFRAGGIAPFSRWAGSSGRPMGELLDTCGLSHVPHESLNQPISLVSAMRFVRELHLSDGPDIGVRVVGKESIADLGYLAEILMSADTLRQALHRLTVAMPNYSTHENIALLPARGGGIFVETMSIEVDLATLHVVQQYVATLLNSLCQLTGTPDAPFESIEITPHPDLGVTYLERQFGVRPTASTRRRLAIFIPDRILDQAFRPRGDRPTGGRTPCEWQALRRGGGISRTVRLYVESMVEDGVPSIEKLGDASGMSLRTLQRRLTEDGTSYAEILDDVRRCKALNGLGCRDVPIGALAEELAYNGTPAFTRAVRRWTGLSPRDYRKLAKPDGTR
ncbi:AraC family transcriptional regulator [uncultured Roseibium sp.]|uniref:helix-turn-helix transcriptional regulator n=1 Tax=uncultured Roseibium sp. TaxID=1936171 RepID=UPI00260305EF|nr:AraC family transcriptional regulator [uncultured Roseibium sp.]